jgi:hypothetical protein
MGSLVARLSSALFDIQAHIMVECECAEGAKGAGKIRKGTAHNLYPSVSLCYGERDQGKTQVEECVFACFSLLGTGSGIKNMNKSLISNPFNLIRLLR